MANWSEFHRQAPELAAAVTARFTAAKHHVLATVRADGSPRVSGTELDLAYPGAEPEEAWIGSMWQSRKALDLLRDPRFALHANPGDGSMAGGDAKLSGIAIEASPEEVDGYVAAREMPPGPLHLFKLDLREVALTSVHPDGDRLVIQVWRPDSPVRSIERA